MTDQRTPRTAAGASTIRDFEAYVAAVPVDDDFAIGGLLDALRKDRQSSLDQIRGAVLAIEAEAPALDVERASGDAALREALEGPWCQYCWADPRYTKITDDKDRRCPVCGADYTGPRRPHLPAAAQPAPKPLDYPALASALRRLYTRGNYLGKRAEEDATAILREVTRIRRSGLSNAEYARLAAEEGE